MDKHEIETILDKVLYGDIYEVPASTLGEMAPNYGLSLVTHSPDEEQSIRVGIAATLKHMLTNNEKCPFCKSEDVVSFKEHYSFCKECTAIYTSSAVVEKNCEHINKESVIVERPPWYKKDRDSVAYIIESEDIAKCSVCGAEVELGGW